MDQFKIGKFIADVRKEQGLTQRELADRLLISDKTVSKWETGKGLPEVSLMMPLCEILGINVNELLSGEKLSAAVYKIRAEENMMKLIKENKENRKKIILSAVIAFITVISAVAIIMVAGTAEFSVGVRAVLIAVAIVVMLLGIGCACVLDRDAGWFQCRKCGELFQPDMKAFIMAPHTLTTRRLRCPKCGKKSYCKKRLSKKD